jgi:FAD/FMN-containing dehydrogenase
MTSLNSIAEPDGFRGEWHVPRSPGYDEARRIWNGQIDRKPAAIGVCTGADDVSAVVRLAAESGLSLSVRGGAHHVAGSAIADGGLVLDLSRMRGIRLAEGTVHVEGGAKLGELDAATLPAGVMVPVGIDSDTGVGGLALGGGVGWTMRRFGLTCDSLRAVTLVTANGGVRRVDDATDPELMWGLRGGGGNFGVVTEFEFSSRPIPPQVLAGFAVYDGSEAPAVLRRYREAVDAAPDGLTTIVFLRVAPPAVWLPPEVVGRKVLLVGAVYVGDPAEGESAVAPLRRLGRPLLDTIAPRPFAHHQAILEGANPVGHRYYWRSAYLATLADDVIDLLADDLANVSSPLSLLSFFQMGGAVAEDTGRSCFPNREAAFLINYAVHWTDPHQDGHHTEWTRSRMSRIESHGLGAGYVNFLADPEARAIRAVYGTERFARLCRLKAGIDPDNLFRHNQNIPPDSDGSPAAPGVEGSDERS